MTEEKRYKIHEILDCVTFDKTEKEYDGDKIWMNSDRYILFKTKGLKCVECGIKGTFFEKTLAGGRAHFNLYGFDNQGNKVLITKDHINPKSKGGKNHINNYQVMCVRCNERKSNKVPCELPDYKKQSLQQQLDLQAKQIMLLNERIDSLSTQLELSFTMI